MSRTPITTTSAPPADPWRTITSRAVHPSSGGDGEPLVATIARGLAAVSPPWGLGPTAATPDGRAHELLLSTEHYDAWLIHWPPGTGLDAHDHGGSTGAFALVSGTLEEDATTAGGPTTRRVRPGEVVWFDAEHVHAVVNRTDHAATSVHVYSPPLSTMGFYRTTGGGELVVDRVEAVTGGSG